MHDRAARSRPAPRYDGHGAARRVVPDPGGGPRAAAGRGAAPARPEWERVCDVRHPERHYRRHDRTRDHLFVMDSLLLPWWSGHPEQVANVPAGVWAPAAAPP